eukprot:6947338-Prymnesium_polylepis.1
MFAPTYVNNKYSPKMFDKQGNSDYGCWPLARPAALAGGAPPPFPLDHYFARALRAYQSRLI